MTVSFTLVQQKGLTYFKPNEIKSSYHKNPLVFTDFKIFNRSVNIGEKINNKVILEKHISLTNHITLSSKQNFISFEFTLLNYGNPSKTSYEYKLENFDKDWVKTDNNLRKAIYTDLKPGNYIFKVKTSNTFNTQEKSISLTITPSFYQSIWFKILIILTLSIPIYFWDRMRTLRIKSEKAMVEKKLMKKKLEYEKEQIALKNERLQYEMENKNAQLTSSALLISHKNDIMKGVKNKLMDFATNGNSQELNGELKNLITSINKEFKVEEDWKRFEEHFNHVHKGFFNKLKNEYNDLSTTNLKLSAYLMMDLTSKEIASLMNISVRGVEKARYRLRQKLNVPKGKKLTAFINNL